MSYVFWVMGYVVWDVCNGLCSMNCVLLVLCYELCVMGYELCVKVVCYGLCGMSCVFLVLCYEEHQS